MQVTVKFPSRFPSSDFPGARIMKPVIPAVPPLEGKPIIRDLELHGRAGP
jgi:hypothetical protein